MANQDPDALACTVDISEPSHTLPMPSSYSPIPFADLPLNKADYPKVQFWMKGDFCNQMQKAKEPHVPSLTVCTRGKSRIARGENVTSRYLEDEHGQVINGHVLMEMRALARQVFQHLHSQNLAPRTWTKASIVAHQYYRNSMNAQFPILRLCEGHWKVDKLAIDSYPGWYRNNVLCNLGAQQESERETHNGSAAEVSKKPRRSFHRKAKATITTPRLSSISSSRNAFQPSSSFSSNALTRTVSWR